MSLTNLPCLSHRSYTWVVCVRPVRGLNCFAAQRPSRFRVMTSLCLQVLPVVKDKVADGLRVLKSTLAAQEGGFILGAELTAADFMIAHAVKDAQARLF